MSTVSIRRAMLVMAMLLTVACAAPAAPSGQPPAGSVGEARAATAPKRITVAIAGDPHTLYQAFNPSSTVRGVEELQLLVNAGLTQLNREGLLEPRLAEAVPTLENGLWKLLPDGRMETTWRVRENATWHDGTPVTARDAVFTAQLVQDRDLPVARHRAFASVEGIDAVDERTITVRWRQPYVEADRMFTTSPAMPVPAHLLEDPYRTDKASFAQLPFWTEQFVGAGPYKIAEFVRGSHMVLAANDRYVLGRPKIETVEARFIVDPNTLIANVLAGTVQVTMGRGISLEQVEQVRGQWREGSIDTALSSFVQVFPQFMNPNPPIVGSPNPQFRRALLHAINRQELVDTMQYGAVPVAHVFVTPEEPEYRFIEDSIVKYDFDPRRAAQMIEQLGYTRGPNNVFQQGGQPLGVEIRATGTDLNQKLMHAIADYWRSIGIAAEETPIPPQRASDLEYRSTFPAFNVQMQGGDMNFVSNFHTSQLRIPETRFSGNNNARYSHLDLDNLIDRYESTIDRGERMRVAAGAVRHITDNVVELPIFYNAAPALIAKGIVNVGAPRGAPTAWNVHLWDGE